MISGYEKFFLFLWYMRNNSQGPGLQLIEIFVNLVWHRIWMKELMKNRILDAMITKMLREYRR